MVFFVGAAKLTPLYGWLFEIEGELGEIHFAKRDPKTFFVPHFCPNLAAKHFEKRFFFS